MTSTIKRVKSAWKLATAGMGAFLFALIIVYH